MSAARQGGGLKALKNISTQDQCENPRRPFLKAIDNDKKTVYFIRPDCKLWSCKACAAKRKSLWVFYANYGGDCLLAEGRDRSFVTLTSHEVISTPLAGIYVWRDAWKKLSARWRRKTPGVQYLYVPEISKAGRFHVHLITSANLPSRWYKDNSAETGLGYQAKTVMISPDDHCGGYVGKYIGKALPFGNWPPYFRRVNTSQKWPRPPEPDTPYDWAYLGNRLAVARIAAMGYARAGWRVESSIEGLMDNLC